MAHLQKIRKLFILRWVSLNLVNNEFRLSRFNLWANGSCQIAQSIRFYGTKKAESSNKLGQITQAAKREAEAALLDYLHATRSLLFTDAETMSKNSPHFLGKLLTRVECNNHAEIRRSLTRFLRYHPINEFEPFFESMGLKPSEYSLLLPRRLMFLNDDPVLMENYHVLCNYGIARKKIGKFYKEAPEIFKYGAGFLLDKLESFAKLGFSQSAVIKLVTSSPHLLVGNTYLDFVEILHKLRSVGPGYGWVENHVSEGKSYDWSLMLEMLHLLCDFGCNEEQLGVLVQDHPELLFDNSGTRTYSLIGFLMKFGSTPDEICDVFLQFPEIVIGTFLENLQHSYRFLVEIEMDFLDIGDIVCSNAILLGSSATKRANNLLRTMSVGKERLRGIVKNNPEVIKNWIVRKKAQESRNYEPELRSQMIKTKFLLDLGFSEDSGDMKRALKLFRGKGLKLQERFNSLVNAGLNPNDVAYMVKVAPQILNLSKDVIQRKIEFLVNDMGYPVSELISFPALISYKIQRIKHRHEMYNWLKDQGAVEPNFTLSTVLACGDKVFIKAYVQRHPKGLEVWERLKQTIYSH